MEKKWMLYGANGYTGNLVAESAAAKNLKPVLAGRSQDPISSIAKSLNLPYRVFPLNDQKAVREALMDIDIVAHCAGPFSATSEPMIKACIASNAHYLDITGEIDVYIKAQSYSDQAKDAGSVICPGVGLDVIPTDCIASRLKQVMPDATHLALGIDSKGNLSPGTAKTSIEGLLTGNRIRKDGEITKVSLVYKVREIDFGEGLKKAISIPWGDVATAYFSTGIPNIEVFMHGSIDLKTLKRMSRMRPVLALPFIQKMMKRKIEKTVVGPNEEQRKKYITRVWGEVKNAAGNTKTARIITANGYDVTIMGVLFSVEFLLNYQGEGGYFTPSLLMGNDLIEKLTGTQAMVIE